jgi:ATP-binding cassette subfamily F protein uup
MIILSESPHLDKIVCHIIGICDQIVAFEDGVGVHVQPGNFSYYLEKRKEREALQRVPSGSTTPPTPAAKPLSAKTERPRKLSFKEQRELEGIEATILAAEMRVTELEKLLNDPDFYVTLAKDAPAVNADLEAAKIEVTRLYARWEELSRIGK